MGFLDELKKMTRPYDDDDEFFDDEDEAIPVAEEPAPARPAQARPAQARPAAARRPAPAPSYAPRGDSRVTDKVVNLSNGKQLQVVLVAPTQFEAAREIADHLLRYHAVLINLEKADPAVARRLIDFLSGVAYAQEGDIRPAASKTYIITPRNVDLMGDQPDDMESGEFHL